MLDTEKRKKSHKKIFPFLPTLEKCAQVMSLSGISHRWESGKLACALSMSSVLINCTLVSFSSSSLWLSVALYISFKYTLLAITLEQKAVPQVKKWLGLLYICSFIENIYSIKGKNKCGPSALSSINCCWSPKWNLSMLIDQTHYLFSPVYYQQLETQASVAAWPHTTVNLAYQLPKSELFLSPSFLCKQWDVCIMTIFFTKVRKSYIS